ncbi:MAG: sugar phosphate nucleotidyltransferase [Flavobacteriales bacterium]|jgi:glucose-1-phosphate thymidylyltransferase|nr:sugar phosphate nucleotidyltransferase [Flavobacteriales bacterium]
MKIIIPMAGRGSRLRPHTLTVPKPLVPIAGKSIVERLVKDITSVCGSPISEIAFIIGDFGDEVEAELKQIAQDIGAKGHIFHQEEALGTAHAILCAKQCLDGEVIVAFADTLFKADFQLDLTKDGVIWVQAVENPEAYGVVKLDKDNNITDFIEKPKKLISKDAIIGVYYFKDGTFLREELQYLLDNDIKQGGEYQLTHALENMKEKGAKFGVGNVKEWLDCGNPRAAIHANNRILEMKYEEGLNLVSSKVELINSVIIQPCYIGENVVLENSCVGPNVSIGKNSKVKDSIIKNSLIQKETTILQAILRDSMIGNFVEFKGGSDKVSIGDYSRMIND